jgi:hypothetical protein
VLCRGHSISSTVSYLEERERGSWEHQKISAAPAHAMGMIVLSLIAGKPPRARLQKKIILWCSEQL